MTVDELRKTLEGVPGNLVVQVAAVADFFTRTVIGTPIQVEPWWDDDGREVLRIEVCDDRMG